MTDTRARDALAAALRYVSLYHALYDDRQTHAAADAILAHPYTPDQRRVLAAAFLDVETLRDALDAADKIVVSGDYADRLLAALRETP